MPNRTKKCACGCGMSVQREFAPGHDARLKSYLLKAARHGTRPQREKATARLLERGWIRSEKQLVRAS